MNYPAKERPYVVGVFDNHFEADKAISNAVSSLIL